MAYAETLRTQGGEIIKRSREAVIVSLGTILTTLLANNEVSVRTGADLGEHMLKAVPSALEPADVSAVLERKDNQGLDLAIDLVPLSASSIAARSTTSTKELVKLAISAQLLASSADTALAEGHLIDRAEMAEKDVGSSALTTAFFTKFLLDRAARSTSERERRAWQAVTAVFAGAITVGAAYIDSRHFYTDFASHGAAVVTGAGSSYLGNRSRNDAAAEAFIPTVENG